MFCINVFFKISLNSLENTWARVSFLLQQETLVQVFSREFSEICKNTYFTKNICEWLLLNIRKCFTKEFPIAFLPWGITQEVGETPVWKNLVVVNCSYIR